MPGKRAEDSLPELWQHQRVIESARESQVKLWIWKVLNEISEWDYDQYLRDGTALCRLMNAIKPGSIKGEIEAGNDFKQKRNNIESF